MPRPCRQCRYGKQPDEAETFDPDCPGCQEKLDNHLRGRSGPGIYVRTGNEPRPAKPARRRFEKWKALSDGRRRKFARDAAIPIR